MDKNEVYEILNKAYFSEEHHEKGVIEHLPELLEDARLFVDIGASLGQYTFFANKCMKGGEILAIEADPIRYERLKQNCAEWQVSSSNQINALNAAMSGKDGKIKFYTTNSNISGGLFTNPLAHIDEKKRKAVAWEEILVDSFKLDTLYNDNVPDLIKMDVEGSELRVLKGAQNILTKGRTKFLIELHEWPDPEGQKNISQVLEFMKTFGYGASDFHGKTFFIKKTKDRSLFLRVSTFFRRIKH